MPGDSAPTEEVSMASTSERPVDEARLAEFKQPGEERCGNETPFNLVLEARP